MFRRLVVANIRRLLAAAVLAAAWLLTFAAVAEAQINPAQSREEIDLQVQGAVGGDAADAPDAVPAGEMIDSQAGNPTSEGRGSGSEPAKPPFLGGLMKNPAGIFGGSKSSPAEGATDPGAEDAPDGETPFDGASEPGMDGGEVAAPPGSAAPSASEGSGSRRGLLGRFVDFIKGKDDAEDGSGEESDEETIRRINELERFSVRNFEKGRLSEAKKNLNDLITLKPYEANYHFALGLCFRREGRHADALKKYQDVLDLGGPKPLVHLLMADSLSSVGEVEKVFEQLKLAAVGGRNIIQDVQKLSQLEQYKNDTEFIKLALSLEKYEVTSKRKPDPMTNPFPVRSLTIGSGDVAEVDDVLQDPTSLTPEQQKNLYLEARKAYDKVQWFIKLEDEDNAMENYARLQKVFEKMDLITIPMIKNDFQRLHARLEPLEAQIEGIRLKYYYNQALEHLKRMKVAFYDTEYEQVDEIFGRVQKLAQDMERTNERYKPVADQVLRSGRVWLDRTRVRQEFEANKPEVQGVIIAPATKQAVINGKIVLQGESLGDFHLQKVENNRITFRYKGEEIPLIFRRY